MKKFLRKHFLCFMTASLAVMFLIMYFSLTHMTFHETDRLFEREYKEIQKSFDDELVELAQKEKGLKDALLLKAHMLAQELAKNPEKVKSHDWILQMGKVLDISSLCVSDANGVLIASTDEGFIGFHMDSTEQSKAFMPACSDKNFELAQNPMERGIDHVPVQYAGVARIEEPGIVQVCREYSDGVMNPLRILQNIMQDHPVARDGCLAVLERADWSADTKLIASSLQSLNGKDMEYIGSVRTFMPNQIKTVNGLYYFKNVGTILIEEKEYPFVACMNVHEMFRGRNQVLLVTFVSFVILMFLLYELLLHFLQKNVINAIYRINEAMEQVIAGNLRVTISEKHLPEFAALTDAVNTTVNELQRRNREFRKRRIGEQEITCSVLNTINDLQPPFYPDVEKIDFAAFFRQSGENGAACVQLLTYEDGSPLFILADSAGSGVAACLYMMKFRATLRNCMDHGILPPLPELLRRLRVAMIAEPGLSRLFMSVFFGHFIPETSTLEYVNAGYIAPILKHADSTSTERLGSDTKCVLSAKENAQDRIQTVRLNPGDVFFAFSPGLVLSSNATKELFGTSKIENILSSVTPSDSAQAILDSMREEWSGFTGNQSPENDIVMVAMRIR